MLPPVVPVCGDAHTPWGLGPREAEAILLGLLLVVGANLAWLGLEPGETAGA